MFLRSTLIAALMLASLPHGTGSVMAVSDSCDLNKDSNYIAATRSLMAGMDKTLFSKDGKISKDGYVYLTRGELAWGGGISPSLCYSGIMAKYANDPNRCPTYTAPEVPGSWAFCSYKNMVVKARFMPTLLEMKSCPSASTTDCKFEKKEIETKTVRVNGDLKLSGTILKYVGVDASLGANMENVLVIETNEGYSLKPNSTASLFGVAIVIETIVEEIKVASVTNQGSRVCQPGSSTGKNITNNYLLKNKNTAIWTSLVCSAGDAIGERQKQQAPTAPAPPAKTSPRPSAKTPPSPPAKTPPVVDWCFYYDKQSDSFLPDPCPSDVTLLHEGKDMVRLMLLTATCALFLSTITGEASASPQDSCKDLAQFIQGSSRLPSKPDEDGVVSYISGSVAKKMFPGSASALSYFKKYSFVAYFNKCTADPAYKQVQVKSGPYKLDKKSKLAYDLGLQIGVGESLAKVFEYLPNISPKAGVTRGTKTVEVSGVDIEAGKLKQECVVSAGWWCTAYVRLDEFDSGKIIIDDHIRDAVFFPASLNGKSLYSDVWLDVPTNT
ncbi:hypothetical protein BGW38_001588 [Lunasporangiospora selenospora]|uniref:Uncharacterized protein n=1 Tax=Lunasporangiospora selenospora TaxID=979761 RepID=A0A9P6KDF4_9FUNG|nr:hypothetical protein BGW38_001588 [Lunasporangiospora selenospora]